MSLVNRCACGADPETHHRNVCLPETDRAESAFEAFATACPHRVEMPTPRRPGNALNVEIGTPAPRCKVRPPTHWGDETSVARWLLSGGDALVLGRCSRARCPTGQTWCNRCGHRGESHDIPGKPDVCAVCGCDGETQ